MILIVTLTIYCGHYESPPRSRRPVLVMMSSLAQNPFFHKQINILYKQSSHAQVYEEDSNNDGQMMLLSPLTKNNQALYCITTNAKPTTTRTMTVISGDGSDSNSDLERWLVLDELFLEKTVQRDKSSTGTVTLSLSTSRSV